MTGGARPSASAGRRAAGAAAGPRWAVPKAAACRRGGRNRGPRADFAGLGRDAKRAAAEGGESAGLPQRAEHWDWAEEEEERGGKKKRFQIFNTHSNK
jgi:hypothetical protein